MNKEETKYEEIKDSDEDFNEDLLIKLMYIYTLVNRNSNEFNN